MAETSSPVVILPGAGGRAPDLTIFRASTDDPTYFETIRYPGWQRYIEENFEGDFLVVDLAVQIAAKVPHGPVRIIGTSIGGYFGYAAALYLQTRGREIAGFCAIDTFTIASPAPSAGWKGRALTRGLTLLRKRRFGELNCFVRSRFWRALLRLTGNRLSGFLRKCCSSGRLPLLFRIDPIFEQELNMRLLLLAVAPWIASLDQKPAVLKAPAILLRTKRLNACDTAAWQHRCPEIKIIDVPGDHETVLEPENIDALRKAFVTATQDWR